MKKCDIANGIGVRVTLFVSGCTNHCPDCFQPQTWDFDYGNPFHGGHQGGDFRRAAQDLCQRTDGAGGEPFEPRNQRELLPLLREVKAKYPGKTIWCFTGFRLDDELLADGSYPRCEATDEMLACIDVLVDGRFMKELKDISLQFRGSRNQRVIDMNRTRETGTICIWDKLRR